MTTTAKRQLVLSMFFVAIASAACVAKEESVAALKSRLESARPEDQSGICVRIAERQLREADRLYTDGHVDDARAAIDDVVTYSEKARDLAIDTRKNQKNVEIAARKMAARLRDIKRTLAFEDQPAVDEAVRRLEDVRTALLKEMFSVKKDKSKDKDKEAKP